MSELQAHVERDGEITVIRFQGRIGIESAAPFREACRTQLKSRKVVFDFRNLNFVGSAGILPFLEALQEFAAANPQGVKFSGIGIEFERILSATALQTVERWERYADAVSAYRHPQSVIQKAIESQPGVAVAAAATPVPLLSFTYERDERENGSAANES